MGLFTSKSKDLVEDEPIITAKQMRDKFIMEQRERVLAYIRKSFNKGLLKGRKGSTMEILEPFYPENIDYFSGLGYKVEVKRNTEREMEREYYKMDFEKIYHTFLTWGFDDLVDRREVAIAAEIVQPGEVKEALKILEST